MGSTAAAWVTAAMAAASTASSVWSSSKQRSAMSKAKREQEAAIAKATGEAKAEKARLDNIEKERLDRLRRRGSGLPPSLLTGMSGVSGAPSTLKPTLG